MERFTLEQAAKWTGGRVTANTTLSHISTDSRSMKEQTLFVPLKGEKFDAHDFIAGAVQNGAAAVVSHREDETYPVPTLYVKNTSQALLDLAGGYRQLCNTTVVGVTGSVGKTTTKELIYSVLREGFRAQKTQENFNNEVGVPLTLFELTRDTETLVCEMGMNHFGELSRMTAAARPDLAVITNIGTAHLEFLGSREGICKAKMEILEGLSPEGTAVFCGDEPLLWEKRDQTGHRTVTYGIQNASCDLIAEVGREGLFSVHNNGLKDTPLPVGDSFSARIRMPGEHNVLNALAAATVGLLLGLTPAQIARGLKAYESSGMRQNIYEKNGFQIFADCYNASPDAMEATLCVLGEMKTDGRRFAVLGSMLELGAYTEEGHLRTGRAAAQYADALYAFGPDAETMCRGAEQAGMTETFVFTDRAEMAQALQKAAKPGDALLFKGSHGMHMEEVLRQFLGEEEE